MRDSAATQLANSYLLPRAYSEITIMMAANIWSNHLFGTRHTCIGVVTTLRHVREQTLVCFVLGLLRVFLVLIYAVALGGP